METARKASFLGSLKIHKKASEKIHLKISQLINIFSNSFYIQKERRWYLQLEIFLEHVSKLINIMFLSQTDLDLSTDSITLITSTGKI